jgi:Ca2+-binding RTX toxin-like protein
MTSFNGSSVTLTGNDGAISIYGASSAGATITTGAGDDHIGGGDGNDTINTGAGNDNIIGGLGADTLTGGAGNDTFHYESAAESTGVNVDTITDFTTGSDTIDLSALSLNGSYVGEANGLVAAQTALTGGGVKDAVFDTQTHQLYVDVNGDGVIGAGDMVITLTGVSDLTNGTHHDVQF